MPTYEYACRSCGHTFEIVQSMSEDALTTCPKCEGELRKVFAPPAIAFKGSGFYATDHGKKAKPSEKSSESSGASSPATTGDGGKDGSSSQPKEGGSTPTSSAASTPAKPAKEPSSS